MLDNKLLRTYPRNLLFIFQISILALLWVYNGKNIDKFIFTISVGLVLIIYLSNYLLSKITSGDNYIFLIVTMLVSIGGTMIYRIDEKLGIKQLILISLGIILFFMTYLILKHIRGWKNWLYVYIGGSYLLFMITFILGNRKHGAINWISIGGFSFQPAEIIKLLLVFILASYYGNIEKWEKIKYSSLYLMAIVYSFILLLFLQKDLGTSLVFYLIFIGIQFIYEKDRKLIFYNAALFSFSGVIGYKVFNHVKIRFKSWLNPWAYIDSYGYQITQSMFAMAEGGFFGKGLGKGYPDFIPVVYTDFIFSAIIEEMGVFTGIGIIMLFLILVYRGFKIAISQEDLFYRILALGVSILFSVQSFIILGGVVKMIPLTGLTLPFVSYGGSSIISSFIGLGILQLCSEEINFKEEEDE